MKMRVNSGRLLFDNYQIKLRYFRGALVPAVVGR